MSTGGWDWKTSRFARLEGLRLADSHHHFWQLGRFPYRWLAPGAPPARFGDKASIQRDFLPEHYLSEMDGAPLVASVHVQANCGADDPAEETRWLQGLSDNTGWPSAAVAEVDLTHDDAIALIDRHRQFPVLRGVRTPVAWDDAGRWRVASRPDVTDDPAFRRAARHLMDHGLTLECVIVPSQLPQIAALGQALGGLKIVINHFATLEPQRDGNADQWRDGISALAGTPNIFVKLSGLWTADETWSPAILQPFVTHLLDSLGAARVIWGSNLPVERVNCPLRRQFEHLETMLADRSDADVLDILGRAAQRVYRL